MPTSDLIVVLHSPEVMLHMRGNRTQGLAETGVRHRLQAFGQPGGTADGQSYLGASGRVW